MVTANSLLVADDVQSGSTTNKAIDPGSNGRSMILTIKKNVIILLIYDDIMLKDEYEIIIRIIIITIV